MGGDIFSEGNTQDNPKHIWNEYISKSNILMCMSMDEASLYWIKRKLYVFWEFSSHPCGELNAVYWTFRKSPPDKGGTHVGRGPGTSESSFYGWQLTTKQVRFRHVVSIKKWKQKLCDKLRHKYKLFKHYIYIFIDVSVI